MYTLADADWKIAERKRKVYQASEARWSREGVTVLSPPNAPHWVGKLKNLLSRLKLSQAVCELTQVSPSGKVSVQSKRLG